MEIHIIDYALYIALFLLGTVLLQIFANKISFPYTIALLVVGFLSQFVVHVLHLDVHLSLPPDIIYFFLLPVLLFEAAMHINIHQFKLQFKTITFLATFGLLLSIFAITVGLTLLLGLPVGIALLFGAIISATDPIAVLALFKTLGAPKRLALIADGESMFNDATGVIAFRVVSGFVVANKAFESQTLFSSVGNFLYVFIGSIIFGIILGIFFTFLVQRLKEDRILITALISSLALGSFSSAEHFFHLSGVITAVIAGITFGNLARGKMKGKVLHFIEEYFSYIGFLALSLVFFFASFELDLSLFARELPLLGIVIGVVLVARALSVYATCFLSNKLSIFDNEPNIPLRWQHILNWGGMRGVIPLVLVYSLPDSFEPKELMLRFTFATLLFTLFVNGLTIKTLLLKLKLHLAPTEEKIIEDELKLFALEEARNKLHNLPTREFRASIVQEVDAEIFAKEQTYKRELLQLATAKEFLHSLKLEALRIERKTMHTLYEQGRFSENVLYEFESELDLQEDALEYPELYKKAVSKNGEIKTSKPFRKRLIMLRRFASKHKLLSTIFGIREDDIVKERYALLRLRLFTSYAVIDYLDRVKEIFKNQKHVHDAINEVKAIQEKYIISNKEEITNIIESYPVIVTEYQRNIISQLIYS